MPPTPLPDAAADDDCARWILEGMWVLVGRWVGGFWADQLGGLIWCDDWLVVVVVDWMVFGLVGE